MTSQWINALSLANKAGKVLSGDRVLPAIRDKKAKLVLLANDASENTKKKYRDKCKFYEIELIDDVSCSQLSMAIGKNNRNYLAIVDGNFAKMIVSKKKGEYYGEKEENK